MIRKGLTKEITRTVTRKRISVIKVYSWLFGLGPTSSYPLFNGREDHLADFERYCLMLTDTIRISEERGTVDWKHLLAGKSSLHSEKH